MIFVLILETQWLLHPNIVSLDYNIYFRCLDWYLHPGLPIHCLSEDMSSLQQIFHVAEKHHHMVGHDNMAMSSPHIACIFLNSLIEFFSLFTSIAKPVFSLLYFLCLSVNRRSLNVFKEPLTWWRSVTTWQIIIIQLWHLCTIVLHVPMLSLALDLYFCQVVFLSSLHTLSFLSTLTRQIMNLCSWHCISISSSLMTLMCTLLFYALSEKSN